ncbi:HAD family phosphatase [Puniceibacterium sp. IMCC21224]|uniref:HAD family hydrolase n=1 Tax=Puniceibacterium sp. IMCC21224 TaxID=1618204 RepID=UPI00064D8F9A|nr:HAD family phosphatase [Puniceibacterium sp. IMCC21224]
MTLALLFDLDGTLLHTDPLHAAVFSELFAQRGRQIDDAFYLHHVHGRQNLDIFGEHFPNEDAQTLSNIKEAAFRARLGAQMPTPGLAALLDQAETQGWPVAVVTNAPRDNAEVMLAAIGMRQRFDTLIIGDECDRGKPDPAPYRAAMAALGVAPDICIAFEDSPSGVASGVAAGALTIGLRSSLTDAALRAAGAVASIADFTDPILPGLLSRRLSSQGVS